MYTQAINKQIADLEAQKKAIKEDFINSYKPENFKGRANMFESSGKSFIAFDCSDFKNFQSILNTLEPSGFMEVKTTAKSYGKFNYRVTLVNGYRDRDLKISFNHDGIEIWVKIKVDLLRDLYLPINDKDNSTERFGDYVSPSRRNLYDTESHYVNIPYHYKKFKDIEVPSYAFDGKSVRFYGGDITLTDSSFIGSFVEFLKGAKNEG